MAIRDECWEWNGSRSKAGYGHKTFRQRYQHTHRLAWAWANGYWGEDGPCIPPGVWVLHKCDNPPCCNPDHLFSGTPAANVADMIAKGRHRSLRGAINSNAKLSDDEVRAIRSSNKTVRALAAEFGVAVSLISVIRQRKRWQHVA